MRRAGALLVLCACASTGPAGALGHRTAEVRKGDLQLDCAPADAEVAVDGVPRGVCSDFAARWLTLGEGLHRVELKREGYLPYQTYYSPGGTRLALTIRLVPRAHAEEGPR